MITDNKFINLLYDAKPKINGTRVVIDTGYNNSRMYIYYDSLNEVYVFFDLYIDNIKLVPTNKQLQITTEYINRCK